MLRLLLLAALLTPLAAAPNASAQSASPAGVVVGVGEVSLGQAALASVRGARALSVGVRTPDGRSYGLSGAFDVGRAYTSVRVGPTAGWARPVVGPLRVALGGEAALERRDFTGRGVAAYPDETALTAGAHATVGVDLGLVGSVRVAPAASAFALLSGTLAEDASRVGEEFLDRRGDDTNSHVGVAVDLPVAFRLLGQHVALATRVEVASREPSVAPDVTTSLRVTF